MKRLIKFLKFHKLNFELVDKYNLIIHFSNNFRAEIYKKSKCKWYIESFYQDNLLFRISTAENLKAVQEEILSLMSCLNEYDFDADCSDGLVLKN